MFPKSTALFALIALTSSRVAAIQPSPGTAETALSGCNTGNLHCCNSVQESDSDVVASIFSLFPQGFGATGSTGQVGFACSPIMGGSSGSISCIQQTACCSDTQFNGAFAFGCSTNKNNGLP